MMIQVILACTLGVCAYLAIQLQKTRNSVTLLRLSILRLGYAVAVLSGNEVEYRRDVRKGGIDFEKLFPACEEQRRAESE